MPAESKSQQAAERGDVPVSKLKGATKRMYMNMSEEELEHYAGTSTKGLPQKKK